MAVLKDRYAQNCSH